MTEDRRPVLEASVVGEIGRRREGTVEMDFLLIAAVVVLPFVGIAVIRFIKRGERRENADTSEEIAKGAGDGIVGGILSRIFWP